MKSKNIRVFTESFKYFAYRLSLILILTFSLTGCKKFLDVDPPVTGLVSETVYAKNNTASAAVTSIYNRMMSEVSLTQGNGGLSLKMGLAADELTNFSTDVELTEFYTNSLTGSKRYFWTELYKEIYVANSAIEGLSSSRGVTSLLKQQLIGESKFLRAFFYFYAVNLYGDVPLILGTDYKINNQLSKSPREMVLKQVETDLIDASSLLSDEYREPNGTSSPGTERIRPNKAAARALLARVYLFMNDWLNAEAQASLLISDGSHYSLKQDLSQVFLKNSLEAIWQLQPVRPGYNTDDGGIFILTTTAPGTNIINPVALSNKLLSSFNRKDKRFIKWVDSNTYSGTKYYFANKYKVGIQDLGSGPSEYLMVLRLAEQFLIRSEARLQQGNTSGAVEDLNVIRKRAGFLDYDGPTDKTSLIAVLLHERQIELFTEWGHRWFDLSRTKTLNSVMAEITPLKGGTWNSNWGLLPIPDADIVQDHNLKQNPGYE